MKTRATDAFGRLSERLRHSIIHSLQWKEFKPVQEQAIITILNGYNAIIIAPTAGGKTEAAILPVIDCLLRDNQASVGALYLSPLRALLNNQEPRLAFLTGMVGLSAFKWHGDVNAGKKRKFISEPDNILMITPESLEVIITTTRYDKKALFGNIHFVVIDEIHAFAGDDRGDHLVALLERLTEYTSNDFQRIGLSATVGNPDVLLSWLKGSSKLSGRIVEPEKSESSRIIEIHPLAEYSDPASFAASMVRGKKSLFFSESRSNSERFKKALEETGLTAFVHHSSVSFEIREDAEKAFREGKNCCIVSTSTMELGLDVGDLDLVLQLDAPLTVSSFLQRLGRTGRRKGTKGHLAFITDEEWTFLQAVAIVSLAIQKFIEPIIPSERSFHVFIHQVLARILEKSGASPLQLIKGAGSPSCFAAISNGERDEIIRHLIATDILNQSDGILTFGKTGEKTFGFAHFRDLYSVFETPRVLRVRTTANKEVGSLEAWFAQALSKDNFLFVLGGKPWIAVDCDWEQGIITVKPAPSGKIPTWMGSPRLLSRIISEEIRNVLIGNRDIGFLGNRAQRCLDRLREQWGDLLRMARIVMTRKDDEVFLYTFAGGRVNNVIGKVIERERGLETNINNFWLRIASPEAEDCGRVIEEVFSRMRNKDYFSSEVVSDLVKRLPRGRLSKFQQLLPQRLEEQFIAGRLLDVSGATEIAGEEIAMKRDGRSQRKKPADIPHEPSMEELTAMSRKILLMVQELHKMGYERLRVSPGMSPSGCYWRCSIAPVTNMPKDRGAELENYNENAVHYSTGEGLIAYGLEDAATDTPRQMAEGFIERFPELTAMGRGEDGKYILWYQEMLRLTGPGDLPIAYADWEMPEDSLTTIKGTTIPFPPPGEAAQRTQDR